MESMSEENLELLFTSLRRAAKKGFVIAYFVEEEDGLHLHTSISEIMGLRDKIRKFINSNDIELAEIHYNGEGPRT